MNNEQSVDGRGGTIPHGWTLPGSSYERIVAPPAGSATDLFHLSNRSQHEFRNPASTQRCEPQNTGTIAAINAVTTYFGDSDAAHTPGHAGRALPHCNKRPAPITFDAYQNIDGAEGAAGGARGTTARGERPRETAARGQRPQSLTDAVRILRAARLRDLLASIAEWERASGPDRTWWRRDARHRLAEWRRLHQTPERATFQAAVQRARAA